GEVGDATYLGQIARRLSAEDEEEVEGAADTEHQRVKRKLTVSKELTPLQQKLEKLAGLISKVGYAAAAAIFLALLVRGILVGEVRWPRTGQNTYTVRDHANPIQSLAFSPDGQRLASASWDVDREGDLTGEIKVRQAATGYATQTLRGHKEQITNLAFSQDG